MSRHDPLATNRKPLLFPRFSRCCVSKCPAPDSQTHPCDSALTALSGRIVDLGLCVASALLLRCESFSFAPYLPPHCLWYHRRPLNESQTMPKRIITALSQRQMLQSCPQCPQCRARTSAGQTHLCRMGEGPLYGHPQCLRCRKARRRHRHLCHPPAGKARPLRRHQNPQCKINCKYPQKVLT